MNGDCHVNAIEKMASTEEQEIVWRAMLAVWGMGCPNCAARVRNSLVMLKGVVDAYVDHNAGIAQVAFNPEMIGIRTLIHAVASAGNDGRHEYQAVLLVLRNKDTREGAEP